MDKEQYISDRVDQQIGWYESKSKYNQYCFKALRSIEIIAAAVIPFIAGYSDSIPCGNIIIGLLGVVIAICAGVSVLNKYQENWLTYRTTCETLKYEKYLFLTGSQPYGNGSDSFNAFVTCIERHISKENAQWASSAIKDEDGKKSSG